MRCRDRYDRTAVSKGSCSEYSRVLFQLKWGSMNIRQCVMQMQMPGADLECRYLEVRFCCCDY